MGSKAARSLVNMSVGFIHAVPGNLTPAIATDCILAMVREVEGVLESNARVFVWSMSWC